MTATDSPTTHLPLVRGITTMIYVVFAIIELIVRIVVSMAGLVADAVVWVLSHIIPEHME